MDISAIHHVALVVDDLERARAFYGGVLGLEELPAFNFDYPTQFYRVNETQQIHLTEWQDQHSFRGHVTLLTHDWGGAFTTCKGLGIVDTAPWGNPRRMPDGSMQMFVRDPSGNLIELISRGEVDPQILEDPMIGEGIYVSGRGDPRGARAEHATLHHDR